MKYLQIICFILVSLTLDAQIKQQFACNIELNTAFPANLRGSDYTDLPGLVGIEFFNTEYVIGDIYLEDGHVAYDERIRYNGRIDGLLLLTPRSGDEIVLDKYFIRAFSCKSVKDTSTIYFSKIKVLKEYSSDTIDIYGQVLYQNKLSLYAFRRYTYKEDVNENVNGELIAHSKYGPSFIYYFKLPNNKTIGFTTLKKRNLYTLFPDNKDTMKQLLREHHQRRFKKENDLVKITALLNSLY